MGACRGTTVPGRVRWSQISWLRHARQPCRSCARYWSIRGLEQGLKCHTSEHSSRISCGIGKFRPRMGAVNDTVSGLNAECIVIQEKTNEAFGRSGHMGADDLTMDFRARLMHQQAENAARRKVDLAAQS